MANLSVFLTNLGKYNEGELVGEWVDLPVSDDELQEVYKRIGISDEPDEYGRYYEETFITDYESDIDGLEIGEYDSITRLNEIAEAIEELDDYDLKVFKNAVEAGFVDADDIEDFDPSRYILYEDVSSATDLAIAEIESIYGSLSNAPKELLEEYFDYDNYGETMRIDFDAATWLDVDTDDPEEVAEVCEQYGVDDLEDITIYDYCGVSDGDKDGVGRYCAEEYGIGADDYELYFDWDGYGTELERSGEYTTDGFIEDMEG
ncbi:MAG: antirestriction protein ArdA [Bacteroidales bacterium]|nr:antirestriction protein ArdA [Bacteroidales bacterium]